ncbi:MAG: SIR2 family protein [Candidatus Omnitrophica bacterium]|nr:SIR2 family protein [Candidatus Omnitrophota bacterium]
MILFLGAGASKPFEIPVTRDFAIQAIDALILDTEYKDCVEFITDIKNSFDTNFDLEIFLTLLDDLSKDDVLEVISPITTRFILKKDKPEKYINDTKIQDISRKLFIGVKDFMRMTIAKKIAEKKKHIINIYNNLFTALVPICGGGSVHLRDGGSPLPSMSAIVTTNYDICIETYLNERTLPFEDNIQRMSGQNYFNLVKVDNPTYRPHLLKLHGSLNLFRLPKGNIVQLQFPYQKYKEIKEASCTYGIDIAEEVILYPTEAGANRRIIETPFTDLYYRFRKTFESDPKIAIIGFSMRDRTICSILEYTLTNSNLSQPKIFLIDPEANRIKNFLSTKGFKVLSNSTKAITSGIEDPQLKNILRSCGENLT